MKRIISKAAPPLEQLLIKPLKRFMNNSALSGIILFSSAGLALILSNSPFYDAFHNLWENEFSIGINGFKLEKSLHHWINDGLMAIFFFVVGLELKREIIAGELKNPKNAILPLVAAIGGMVFPALIYFFFNPAGENFKGWGIPMATDIAFALGVLYLLGDRVPVSLKVFLTALAIADDLGAVLVIAIFYTSDINLASLFTGGIFLLVLVISNLLGVRNTVWYAIIGIGGLWTAFLMSGVHATVAAVLAAFTIPASAKVSKKTYQKEVYDLITRLEETASKDGPTVSDEQLHILEQVRTLSSKALPPLQRLEHRMHPIVAFFVMPIFALSNAGIHVTPELFGEVFKPVTLGIFFGLLLGKFTGVVGVVYVMVKLKLAQLPADLNKQFMVGAGLLAAVGFTMSLFISGLAFENPELLLQSKLGILMASLTASISGFLVIRDACIKAERKAAAHQLKSGKVSPISVEA
jgi:NhaA family Na+:H+ antiporter